MAGSPLCLSGPLYDWAEDASAEPVSFDDLHQRVIHQRSGGFSTVDIVQDGGTPDGLFVKFEAEGLRRVRFSPDGLHFAFLCGKRFVGCAETLQPSREAIPMGLRWGRNEVEVLDLLWLPAAPQPSEHADVAVVTTHGIETFRLSFEQRTAKSLKAIPAGVRMCWTDPGSGMVLACTGPRTLQPFDLTSKSPKMPRFDLVLARDQVIEALDVAVMTVYDSTYCIHADSANGRVSLRNISNPAQGTPEHDIVIDLTEEEAFSGTLRLSKVDHLLIVHCVERMVSMVFDIRHRERSAVPSICGPSPIVQKFSTEGEISWAGWRCLSGSAVLDARRRQVFRLGVDMGSILQHFLARSPHDLATVIRFLLRRANCREHIVQTLKRALLAKTHSDDWSKGFSVLNHAYRQTIEAVSQKGTGQGRQATVSLQELESVIGQQSILSEKDMVAQVFYPHFLGASGLAVPSSEQESWRVPLPTGDPPEDAGNGGRPARSPYLLSVVLAYLRSLLGVQILPHKSLQCFVFDICMHFRQEHTLQQLLHYHVLLDSPELVQRLRDVAVARGSAWATQACLDMALRIHEYSVVGEMLLHTKQYLDVVPFLMSQHETSFKLRQLLERLDADEAARAEDPDLLEHVLSEVRGWRREAEAGTDNIAPPDLEGCERWMPELGAARQASPQQK
eukprot:CAMPEP_0204571496 /NCGR_PEP_ID=MMETSP0661-20131031/38923_1 /ASSEMBLY_ACC=CAM_ASM_000606 /TAXON_ID=109239 /ORGANISM="Alexandrium margalefi, Strain AMGDE01CS-322" /LENGTH=674 /DNA_ID=CAMNT_0051579761 /DNA_START=85 /DNA_END=2106 /DNA_ORIENTATION=+